MVILGLKSLRNISECKEPLVIFIKHLVEKLNHINDPELQDITITCGLRGKEDQEKAVSEGNSFDHWPTGRHNNPNLEIIPEDISSLTEDDKSSAVDIVPYPSMWDDKSKLNLLGKYGKQCLAELNMSDKISWGGDGLGKNHKFIDLPHWQINK
jgi:hypothetical protein